MIIITDDCMGCMQCIESCPKGAIILKRGKRYSGVMIDKRMCIGCGMCLTVDCPSESIRRVEG